MLRMYRPLALCWLLFPATFALLIPILVLLLPLRQWVQRSYIIAHLNVVLVEHGYFWFTAVYLGHLTHYTNKNWVVPYDKIARELLIYLVNTLFCILATIWCFGPLIFERIDVAAGGHCERISGELIQLSRSKCDVQTDTIWINGFDISGHFYLLVSISLLVLQQLIGDGSLGIWTQRLDMDLEQGEEPSGVPSGENTEAPAIIAKLDWWILHLAVTLVGCWYAEFVITCLFFHTTLEKFCGLVAAMVVPLVTLRYIITD